MSMEPEQPSQSGSSESGLRGTEGQRDTSRGVPDPTRRGASDGESPFMTLISACLFLYVGFVYAPTGISANEFYNSSVTAFTWGARIVGIGLLAIAALSFMGLAVLLLDLLVSFIAAAGCVVIGAIWVMHSDQTGYLVLLFGLLNSAAAKSAFVRWRAGVKAAAN